MSNELDFWQKLEKRIPELEEALSSPFLDASKRQSAQKELSQISNLLAKHKEILALQKNLEELTFQRQSVNELDLQDLYDQEIEELESSIEYKNSELDDFLYPADPLDDRSVFLEIRAGTGGQEAALFASDLLRMYTNYALKKGWKANLVDSSTTDLGGFREVVLHIQGPKVYAHLKRESGVHRVQRVPKTETQGRIHTSTATVAALPEAHEVEININPADLRIDVFRASGAGGQHVNTTDSAVRITHIPTGVVVSCQDERSQHKNKAKALKVLQSRILAAEKEKHAAEQSQKRKEMVGSGQRSEKLRTYNFPQNRITDHILGVTLNKLDMVLEGNLDEIIEAGIEQDKIDRKNRPSIF